MTSLKKTTNQWIEKFKTNGVGFLDTLKEPQIEKCLRTLNQAYYNNQSLLNDHEYDIIKEYLQKNFSSNKILKEVGFKISKNKVRLPYEMWSLDKIKPDTNALQIWKEKYLGSYIISVKLDGISGLYSTEEEYPKLYTRGDGKIGQDISHLIVYLKLPKEKGLVIRGEFVIRKDVFQTKYKTEFTNSRNMVSGIINSKQVDERIKDICFVAHEIIQPILKPNEQMNVLEKLEVEVVFSVNHNTITNEVLSLILKTLRNNHIYDMDGLVIKDNNIYEKSSGNPKHAFAFKMILTEQIAEAKVVDVIWNASKDGYLKPQVRIEPIHLCGVEINYTTGFNASFIYENKIGVGSILKIIRSGDVIPHIKEVMVSSENAKMPDFPYKWNETKIDIMLDNVENNKDVKEKNITFFFKGIKVYGLSSGIIKQLIKSGHDSVLKIIKMEIEDYLNVPGFKIKLATKIHNNIQEQIKKVALTDIMASSNLLGRGVSLTKIEKIVEEYPNILFSKETDETKIENIVKIKGFQAKTAELFVKSIPKFMEFFKQLDTKDITTTLPIEKPPTKNSHILSGKDIVISGFRNDEMLETLKQINCSVKSNVNANTYCVVVKNLNDKVSTKLKIAFEKNIPVISYEDFIKRIETNTF
jgi:NAD-dependent DNA ligase